MSVWDSAEALRAYVYGSAHTEVMRRRQRWFSSSRAPTSPFGGSGRTRSPIDEAKARLARIDREGPSPSAFTFKQLFAPPA